MKCCCAVFAAYHSGCMLEPWLDPNCGNTFIIPWQDPAAICGSAYNRSSGCKSPFPRSAPCPLAWANETGISSFNDYTLMVDYDRLKSLRPSLVDVLIANVSLRTYNILNNALISGPCGRAAGLG